ncbi:GTP-binding protein [Alkalibaculum sp. M08DMB]|uniref:GTP-binding protein n=1 Tax=Alkalibaculum sporogenes TaxID=2655001 RepID=A0A6A7KB21_9FIRM|nr:GTP-binding protein [Alkalibaculum sporogenes]
MVTEIFIISGFLGAGKTTLIQKLLKEAFQNEKVVLIENDFGDISVDAALLKSGGIEVKEINSGCICCSLSGDFMKALKELLERFHPDKVVIEPSGVGKLSDIMKVCSDPRILPLAKVKAKITIADVKRCKTYLDNFGEFFEDQIQNADIVLLSRSEEFPDSVNDACKLIKELNAHAPILSKPWHQIVADEILCPKYEYLADARQKHNHEEHCHGEHCHCGQDHAAEEVFDTVTIRINRVFSIDDLKERVLNMERNARGTILRAKGIVRGPSGYMNLQYLPGDIKVTKCETRGGMICIIGRNLSRQELCTLFSGE